ncbi:MAG: hypothetical protein Q8942_20055, partial [Bacillota bacterium]|nr:hypothetical protein [Bacillota bacterium]
EEVITGNNWDYETLFDPSKKIPFEVSVTNAVYKENKYITADVNIKNVYADAVEGLVTTELYNKENQQLIEKKQQVITLNAGENRVITEQFTKDVPYVGAYFIKTYMERSEGSNVPAEIEFSNTATAYVKTLADDKTPPVISGAATSVPNKNGWYNSDVTIHFDAKDDISGVDILTPDTTITQEGEEMEVTGVALDKAGNMATIDITGINIDKTKPVIIQSLPDTQSFGSSITLAFEAQDQLSGIESAYVLLDGAKYENGSSVKLSKFGDINVELIAEDKAGNVTSVSKIIKVIAPQFKVSGYVIPSFLASSQRSSKLMSGFKVEIVGTGLTAISDENGYFEIKNVHPDENYTLQITKKHYLLREIKNVEVGRDVQISAQSSPIEMWAGDMEVNGTQDGVIKMEDVMEMAKLFNTCDKEPVFKPDYDFNGDARINLLDIVIIAIHFGRSCYDEN